MRSGRIVTLVEWLETEVAITWDPVRHPSCSDICTEDVPITRGISEVYTHVQIPVSTPADPRFSLMIWNSYNSHALTSITHNFFLSLGAGGGSRTEQS